MNRKVFFITIFFQKIGLQGLILCGLRELSVENPNSAANEATNENKEEEIETQTTSG